MNEREKLKAEIKAELIEELAKKEYRATNDMTKPLGKVYNKHRDALYKKYGIYQWAKVWESIRNLAIRKAGCSYVRELKPETEKIAADFAEKLCVEMLGEMIKEE